MGSIIKSVIPFFEQGGMEVWFYGDREPEIFRECICCGQYHPIYIGVCPIKGKVIAGEAQRQAEEEERLRNLVIREAKAKAAKEKYLLDYGFYRNSPGWKNSWRYFIATFGAAAVFLILAYIFNFPFGTFQFGPLIAIIVSVLWFVIWMQLDKKHRKLISNHGHAIYRHVLWGGEVADIGEADPETSSG